MHCSSPRYTYPAIHPSQSEIVRLQQVILYHLLTAPMYKEVDTLPQYLCKHA
ncbi:hypothetical protein PQZ60_gp10 [Klebsiella phage vB_KpnM_FZ14]|uniref:hypothetical protein n=1 Tax=Klebsiella phage vB_KpnM_FZ14 TaxID=2530028 RepID=UPI00233E6A5A|nr:hypothetical protein PQZ60_gp10 [Klebsiella phage vB_KpnM_FZ14]